MTHFASNLHVAFARLLGARNTMAAPNRQVVGLGERQASQALPPQRIFIAIHGLKEASVLVKRAADREWSATDYPGIERSLFRNNETGGRSSAVRLARGSRFPRHAHQGTEEVVVLSGTVNIGGVELNSGDYLFTSAGEEHDVVAVADALIFVSSQKGTPVVE